MLSPDLFEIERRVPRYMLGLEMFGFEPDPEPELESLDESEFSDSSASAAAPEPEREEAEAFESLSESMNDRRPASASRPSGSFNMEFKRSALRDMPPPWNIGFSRQFLKDTAGLDRKLAGRILEALEHLSMLLIPLRAEGDTFKPLKGDLEGCWRYRVGDFRLVIRPDAGRACIDAVAFGARGSIYE